MDGESVTILIIDSNLEAATTLAAALESIPGKQVSVAKAHSLEDGLEKGLRETPDIAFLNIESIQPAGLAVLVKFHEGAPDIAVVVVVPPSRELLGEECLTKGATDYLIEGTYDRRTLARCVRYTLERHQMHETLRGLALIDEPTGFYNLTGFSTLAEYQMILARRTLKRAFIIRCQLQNLDQIRSDFGNREADTALKAAAEMLRVTFRTTDILGRLSRNEFVCYVNDVSGGTAQAIVTRLVHNVETFNQLCSGPYNLDLRVGIARIYGGDEGMSVEDLIRQAGEAMKAPEEVRLVT